MNLVLFDLDNTLLDGDSDHTWGNFLIEEKLVDVQYHQQQNDAFWRHYQLGTLDIRAYLDYALQPLAAHTMAELAEWHRRFMQQKIEPMVTKAALALVEKHKADLCAIVTATNAFITRPIATRFGIDTLIACEPEIIDGRYTGRLSGTPSFREGKVARVEQWLAGMGKTIADFERSYFYSDSHNDLPLLQAVSHPVVVDPDNTLRAWAEKQGWPIMSLKSETVC